MPWSGAASFSWFLLLLSKSFLSHFRRCKAPDPGLAECYRVPLPVDLKIPLESLSPWRGGETEGLQRLEQHLTDQVSPEATQVVPPGGLRSLPSLAWRRGAAWAWVLFSSISGKQERFPGMISNKAL